jgi:hypothetical protein
MKNIIIKRTVLSSKKTKGWSKDMDMKMGHT